ncbi:hypothetical protein BH11PLA2_BH11PLA2_37680 [soil metagenome]
MSRMMTLDWTAPRLFQSAGQHFNFEGRDDSQTDRARWVLALGVVSLLVGPLGFFAWMAGNACLKAISDGRMDPTSESNARAGRLLGIIAICMFAIKLALFATFMTYFYWLDVTGWILAIL